MNIYDYDVLQHFAGIPRDSSTSQYVIAMAETERNPLNSQLLCCQGIADEKPILDQQIPSGDDGMLSCHKLDH